VKDIRAFLVFITGGLLIYLGHKFQHEISALDSAIWLLLIIVGLILLIWTIITDFIRYKEKREIVNFSLTAICIGFTFTIWLMEYQIQKVFDKPTLLKVYYNGDINGTGIDFKTDGSYIFENSAIGLNDYRYGSYEINGDFITLDQKTLENVIETDLLQLANDGSEKQGKVLFQLRQDGEHIKNATEFRVVIDNRGRRNGTGTL
jgi:hypothetical protein